MVALFGLNRSSALSLALFSLLLHLGWRSKMPFHCSLLANTKQCAPDALSCLQASRSDFLCSRWTCTFQGGSDRLTVWCHAWKLPNSVHFSNYPSRAEVQRLSCGCRGLCWLFSHDRLASHASFYLGLHMLGQTSWPTLSRRQSLSFEMPSLNPCAVSRPW